jgi:hypothetical protein
MDHLLAGFALRFAAAAAVFLLLLLALRLAAALLLLRFTARHVLGLSFTFMLSRTPSTALIQLVRIELPSSAALAVAFSPTTAGFPAGELCMYAVASYAVLGSNWRRDRDDLRSGLATPRALIAMAVAGCERRKRAYGAAAPAKNNQ